MSSLVAFLVKIIPLYILIGLGYIAGKKLRAQKETIASILIYIVLPVVVFNTIITTEVNAKLLSLPFIFLFMCCILCVIFYLLGKKFFKDSTKNILAFTAGSGNTGYFGIPLAVSLFGEESLGIVIFCLLGFTLYENSLGFFITARGKSTLEDALRKLLKLPAIYSFTIAVILNYAGCTVGESFVSFARHFTGAYIIFGMMLIGVGLSCLQKNEFDTKFITLSFIAKFIAWPLLVLFVIFIDKTLFDLFNNDVYKVMFLFSVVPMAANTVAYATELKAHPEKASLAVFLSTVFALVYIPSITSLVFKWF